NLTHEKERLSDWMYGVLPPLPLDDGARGPELKSALAPASPAAASAAPAAPAAATAPAAASAPAAATASAPPASIAPTTSAQGVDPEAVYQAVLAEETSKGSDPRVAEARAKAAAMRARSGPDAGAAAPAEPARAPAAQVQSAPVEVEPSAQVEGAPSASTEAVEESAAAPSAGVSADEAAEVRKRVLEEELAKGSDPRVAEARAKAAEMRARKGTAGPAK
ncbi:MAG: hypothetical protein LC723_05835, partial [Actinobacteria bacterium]|nr:hypothetical protein [Actinomycetota bacterium]